MSIETIASPIIIKYFTQCFDFIVSKILKRNRIWISQEDKDELVSGLRIATYLIRYALKSHNGKRQLTFGSSSQSIDVEIISYWLYDYFLNFYYATLTKKIKKQIVVIHNLMASMDMLWGYSHSFRGDNVIDTAYSLRYQQSFCKPPNPENIKQGKEIADKIFEIVLPDLLKAYTELTKLFQRENLID